MYQGPEPAKDDAVVVDFGTILRRLRTERKLSQSELAERAHMSAEAISALERGFRKRPQAGTVDLLGVALALDKDQFRAFRDSARSVPRAVARAVTGTPEMDTSATNLPLTLTSFIGRETEIAEISKPSTKIGS